MSITVVAMMVGTTCGAGNGGARYVAVMTLMAVVAVVVVGVSRNLCVEPSKNNYKTEARRRGREEKLTKKARQERNV